MTFTWHAMAAGALLGTLALTFIYGTESRWYTAGAFMVIWVAEFVLWLVWDIFIYPHFLSPLRHLPQPGGAHWLLGHGLGILQDGSGIVARKWINEIPNDGLIRHLFFFNRERILVCSPRAVSEVLVTNNYGFIKTESMRKTLGRLLGFGLLLAEGDEHKIQRRNLMPAFAFRHVKDLYPVFWSKARETALAMTASMDGQDVGNMEIGGWASRCTLDIIGVAGLGRDFGAIKDENNSLVQTYHSLTKPSVQERLMFVAGAILPYWFLHSLPIRWNGDVAAAAETIRGVCRDLIREKKARLANKEQPDIDILSVALESSQFTDDDLVNQLMTFLAAGHDTTATAVTWAIYALCIHQDMQKQLREEIRQRLPSLDADISSLDIDHMPYLNAFCNEVLRYYAPVPHTARQAAQDTTIQGYPIPKGTRILIAPWAMNMDPSLWGPDATKFKPERWLPKFQGDTSAAGGGASSNFANLTFLHGPRSCIGQSFAKAEFACVVAAWVGRFEFDLQNEADRNESKLKIKVSVTARPAEGMHVKMKLVEGF